MTRDSGAPNLNLFCSVLLVFLASWRLSPVPNAEERANVGPRPTDSVDRQPLPVRPGAAMSRDAATPELQIAHVLFMDMVGYSRLDQSYEHERHHRDMRGASYHDVSFDLRSESLFDH